MSFDVGANLTRARVDFVPGEKAGSSERNWLLRQSGLLWRAAYRFLERSTTRALLAYPNAETAHRLALRGFQLARLLPPSHDDELLKTRAFGLSFPNPIGVAAGLDKDAQVVDLVLRRGFGFAEIGTVTPEPQSGNDPPRVFRLRREEAIINHFGFNSLGSSVVLARLRARAYRGGIVGVNIGANRTSSDRVADYVASIKSFAEFASYFTVNISSPNTPGLRDLQEERAYDDLLARVLEARDHMVERFGKKPVLLKISPDVSLSSLDALVAVSRRRGIDGIIVSNTTISRSFPLEDPSRTRAGGLSGHPIFEFSTRKLAQTFIRVEGAFPLIGVGGIDSGKSAWTKIRAGATLIQLYTALVYKGPGLLDDIKSELTDLLKLGRHERLSDVVGADAAALSEEP